MASQRRHRSTRKNRGRFRGLYKLLSVLVVLAAIFIACIVFFRVKVIRAEGNRRYTEADIIRVSGVKEGDYLALLDGNRIRRQIRAQLPYVEGVLVQRILPDTVLLTVEESSVAAAAACQGQWWLINSAGKLLETVPAAEAQTHPVLEGIELLSPEAGIRALVSEEDANRWNSALALLSALEKRGDLSRLQHLDCSSAGSFTARYGGAYTLLLPTTIEYEYLDADQFSHFLSLLDEALPQLEEGQDVLDFTHWEATGYIYARHSE